MGYKNNWHRDNVETRQVTWPHPLADQPVAIIGGGISGLACAQVCLSQSGCACHAQAILGRLTHVQSLRNAAWPLQHAHTSLRSITHTGTLRLLLPLLPQGLAQHAMKAAVFDTGEHGVGGRAATRTTTDPSVHADWLSKDSSAALRAAGLTFDHAAQCFTATDPAFQQQCEAWVAAGAVKRWRGPVGTLRPGGVFTPLDSGVPVYVATGGMRQLAESMAEEVRGTAHWWMILWVCRQRCSGYAV